METCIIDIGNSKGIILPTALLKKLKLSVESMVRVFVEDDAIVIKPVPRQGWESAAKQMHAYGEDALLMPEVFDDENILPWDNQNK